MIPKEMQIGELARLIGVEKDLIKKWLYLFEEYFSPRATHPKDGQPRIFNHTDIRRLLVIGYAKDWWEDDDGDYSSVYGQLNSSEEYEDDYLHEAYLKAPLFQSIPDNPEEMATYTVMLGESWIGSDLWAIAESYKYAGDILVNQALDNEEPWKLAYPILLSYRHSIELFLKAIVHSDKATHNLSMLMLSFEKKLGSKLRPDIKSILDQFAEIDAKSTTFRYGEEEFGERFPCTDTMVNLHQLFFIMDFLAKWFSEILTTR